ncbi:D-aminoacyl-tRNA deacylase, partial [Clostridium saudiense]|nr:D-aminoacyl-tRNA deacylase [Clostridium saudiense]
MRAVVQRVKKSSVKVDGEIVGSIQNGLNVLVGICEDDTLDDLKYIVDKVINLRIFNDDSNKMNLSVKD